MSCVSVIIPVYNVEAYIDECVQSVLNQTYANMQIILVNDGSTDNSGAKCDAWAEKDSRIVVSHKPNGGASSARNLGVRQATGEYVLFLDGDDFWDDSEAVSKLMKRINQTQADVLNFSYKKYYEDTKEIVPYFHNPQAMPLGLSKAEQLAYLTQNGLYIASPCNKLLKKSVFQNDQLLFREGVYSEDIEWCAKLLCCAKEMDFVSEEFYCYRQRRTSASHAINDKKCKDLYDNLLLCFEMLQSVSKDVCAAANVYMAYQYGTFFAVQAQAENRQTEYVRGLQKYKWILRYHGGNLKIRLLYYCCNIIGYQNTCRLMRLVYRKK